MIRDCIRPRIDLSVRVIYSAHVNGAAIKCWDASEGGFDRARQQLINRGAWDSALGPDPVRYLGVNAQRYTIETHVWDDTTRRYVTFGRTLVAVERDCNAARQFLDLSVDGPVNSQLSE
jgi:hypothetical protein